MIARVLARFLAHFEPPTASKIPYVEPLYIPLPPPPRPAVRPKDTEQ